MGTMKISQISENYMVSPQISVADVAEAKAAGFDTIMCNRPDAEEAGQPSAAQIQQAAQDSGMKFFHVPMSPAGMADDTLDNFRAAIAPENGKVLAYCRTGNRSSVLWNMVQQ